MRWSTDPSARAASNRRSPADGDSASYSPRRLRRRARGDSAPVGISRRSRSSASTATSRRLSRRPRRRALISRRRGRWQRVAGGVDSAVTTIEQLARKLPETAILAMGHGGLGRARHSRPRAGALEFLRCPLERVDLVAALEKLARFRGSAPQRNPGRIISVFAAAMASARRHSRSIWPSRWPSAPKARRCSWSSTPGSRNRDVPGSKPRYSIHDVENLGRMDESLPWPLDGARKRPRPRSGRRGLERGQFSPDQVSGTIEVMRSHFDHVLMDLRHDFDLDGRGARGFGRDLVRPASTSPPCARGRRRWRLPAPGPRHEKDKVVVMRDGPAT